MLLYKNVPHNFEVHFEDKLFDSKPVQFLDLDSDYLVPAFKDILSNYESASFNDWWGEEYNTNVSSTDFSSITSCSFKSFFKGIEIDTPRCFSKSYSLKRDVNKYCLYKMNNYLLRGGKSLKVYMLLLKSLRLSFVFNDRLRSNYVTYSWLQVYNTLSNFIITSSSYKLPDSLKISDPYGRLIDEIGTNYTSHNDYRTSFIDNLKLLEPMFLFYIYKVDKNIYKNSRGRSGKFTFLWKYVSPYKRRYLVMSWLAKEVKMQPGKNFYSRLFNVINNLITNPNSTFISKIRKFSYNYVYYNCRKTLAETYRTSTK